MTYLNWNDSIFNQPKEIKTDDSVVNNSTHIKLSSTINNLGTKNVTSEILNAIKNAIRNNKILVIPPGTYLVNQLSIPANARIHCMEGSLFLHEVVSSKFERCIIFDQPNITITGRLSVDGNYDKQTYDSEHIHNIAIFGATNLSIESIESNNAWSDAVSISGADGSTQESYTTGIRIGYIKSKKARRKNIVFEHVTDCVINTAILDNTEGSTNGRGGHCFHVEPYNYNSHKVNNTVKYLYAKGTGANFGSSIGDSGRNYVMNINTFVCDILALDTEKDDGNGNEFLTPIYAFGNTINIENMRVDLPTTKHPSFSSWDGVTHYPALMMLSFASKVNIKSVVIKGGVSGTQLCYCTKGSWNGVTGKPNVLIDYLKADINNMYIVNANEVEQFSVNNYMIKRLKGKSTSRTGITGSLYFGKSDDYMDTPEVPGDVEGPIVYYGKNRIIKIYYGEIPIKNSTKNK